jgi:hypothetical protein
MSPPPSTDQLIELVHRYYPASLSNGAPGYTESKEYQRLLELRREVLAQHSTRWEKFTQQVQEALPDCTVEDWTVLWAEDNCWRARVYLPQLESAGGENQFRAVVLLVSILAPVYVLYSSFQARTAEGGFEQPTLSYEPRPETTPIAEVLSSLVRTELGVQPLSNEVLFTSVPDIQCGNVPLGKVKLIDCLFTDDRW